MRPTCQLPIYQLRFFYLRASSPATPLSSPRGLWLQIHLLSPPLLPSIPRLSWNKAWVPRLANETSQLRVWKKLCSPCLPTKKRWKVRFLVPVSPCSSEVRLFPDLLHGSADPHPQIYTYQHHIPTPNKMTSERRNGHCMCFPTSIYCYQGAATFFSFQRRWAGFQGLGTVHGQNHVTYIGILLYEYII